jgi:hypothetical protein
MTSEVVAEIEAQARELRAGGLVPEGIEEELDRRFEDVAEQSLAAGCVPAARAGGGEQRTSLGTGASLAELAKRAKGIARRRFGPLLRRVERRSALGARRAAASAWIQVYVVADHLGRVADQSTIASRVLATLGPQELAAASPKRQPSIDGPLLTWVLERLSSSATGLGAGGDPGRRRSVLHAECGDGRIVEALAARGLDARGTDPRWSVRSGAEANIVAGGALEYLGAAPPASFDGLLLTGVVDRLRPGAARALAQLAARSLAPGGVVVLVSTRPEANVAMDPVAADLAPGGPLHPVTWCHLLASYGLGDLAVFEPDASDPAAHEPELFAVSARRPGPGRESGTGGGL